MTVISSEQAAFPVERIFDDGFVVDMQGGSSNAAALEGDTMCSHVSFVISRCVDIDREPIRANRKTSDRVIGTAMLFRQLFDSVSGTYTYLLASRRGGEALIIDPVLEKVERYLQLVKELDLKLVKAVDTHLHADHITGLGALRDRTQCITVMGERSKVDVVSMRLAEGDRLTIEGLALDVLYTPGHTDDSYSFLMDDRVFTGDTLLIRGTGRTDFQNGDPRAQYNSIFNKLLKLPDDTLVYPGARLQGRDRSRPSARRRRSTRACRSSRSTSTST